MLWTQDKVAYLQRAKHFKDGNKADHNRARVAEEDVQWLGGAEVTRERVKDFKYTESDLVQLLVSTPAVMCICPRS